MSRHVLLRAAIVLILGLVLGAAGLGLFGPRPAPFETSSSPTASNDQGEDGRSSLAIKGLQARLIDEERTADKGQIFWSTSWRLCWEPVPAANRYVVTEVSFEGAGGSRELTEPCYELSVANGVTNEPGKYPGREQQLDLMESTLSVSVAARLPDGTVGPASPDIPVAAEYP